MTSAIAEIVEEIEIAAYFPETSARTSAPEFSPFIPVAIGPSSRSSSNQPTAIDIVADTCGNLSCTLWHAAWLP
jgi:hypothetical protein